MLFHWPLYADFRRLAARLAGSWAPPVARMRLERVSDVSALHGNELMRLFLDSDDGRAPRMVIVLMSASNFSIGVPD